MFRLHGNLSIYSLQDQKKSQGSHRAKYWVGMRLINTSTRELQTFFAEAVPNYAILSHRWNEKEVSFQDLQDGRGEKMPEYSKIERCCVQAQLDGLQYVWIDSCCIDKTSSAEYVKPFFKFHFHSTIGVQFFPYLMYSSGHHSSFPGGSRFLLLFHSNHFEVFIANFPNFLGFPRRLTRCINGTKILNYAMHIWGTSDMVTSSIMHYERVIGLREAGPCKSSWPPQPSCSSTRIGTILAQRVA